MVSIVDPILLYYDNLNSIHLVRNPVFHTRTVKNNTKKERELVLEKVSTISTKRMGLRKTPERGKETRRERER